MHFLFFKKYGHFVALFLTLSSLQAMEEQKNQRKHELFNSKKAALTAMPSTDEDVSNIFNQLINNNIDATKLQKPKTLLDGVVQLNILFRNLEVNFNNSHSSFRVDGLVIEGAEMPSHPLFISWMKEALQLVLENNEKVKNLVDFVVKKLAKNVTKDNKTRCMKLINSYLPDLISKHVETHCAYAYGWQDSIGLCTKGIQFIDYDYQKVFPIDATRIAIAYNDIQIWNPSSLKCEKKLKGHEKRVSVIAYTGENIVASGSYDTTIKIWDINTEECLKTLKGHTSSISALKFMDDTTLVSTNGNTIKTWNITTGDCLQTFKGPYTVFDLIKLDENTIIFSSENTVKKLNIRSGKSTIITKSPLLNSLTPLTNNNFIICLDDEFSLWDAQTCKCLKTFKGHSGPIRKIIAINDTTLASSANDKTIKIWDITTAQCKRTLHGHQLSVNKLATINNNILISASFFLPNTIGDYDKQTVKIWNVNTGKCLQTFSFYDYSALCPSYLVVTDKTFVTPVRTLTRNDALIIDFPTFEQTIDFLAQQKSKKLEKSSCTIS